MAFIEGWPHLRGGLYEGFHCSVIFGFWALFHAHVCIVCRLLLRSRLSQEARPQQRSLSMHQPAVKSCKELDSFCHRLDKIDNSLCL